MGSPRVDGDVLQLRLAGLTPILTHPERNPTLQEDQRRMVDWMRGGIARTGYGRVGTGPQGQSLRSAWRIELLANRWVHFLATDAHNTTSRPPQDARGA